MFSPDVGELSLPLAVIKYVIPSYIKLNLGARKIVSFSVLHS